jgi:hypothetical protein
LELFESLNFAKVYDMLGGITDWIENGLPIVDPTVPPTTTPPPTTTAGELASFGTTLYNQNCTFSECHARFEGGGGELQLSSETISPLGNAEVVFGIVSSIMHLAIGDYEEDAPTLDEYLQILAYVLIETDLIQSADPFDRNSLPNVLFN